MPQLFEPLTLLRPTLSYDKAVTLSCQRMGAAPGVGPSAGLKYAEAGVGL
jgi:hypothetical protein